MDMVFMIVVTVLNVPKEYNKLEKIEILTQKEDYTNCHNINHVFLQRVGY